MMITNIAAVFCIIFWIAWSINTIRAIVIQKKRGKIFKQLMEAKEYILITKDSSDCWWLNRSCTNASLESYCPGIFIDVTTRGALDEAYGIINKKLNSNL